MAHKKRILSLTPEEEEKVRQARERYENKQNVDRYWYFIAEFGYYYGWGGIDAILANRITLSEAHVLLEGAKKAWSGQIVDHIQANQAGNASTKGKKGIKIYSKILKAFQKRMRL